MSETIVVSVPPSIDSELLARLSKTSRDMACATVFMVSEQSPETHESAVEMEYVIDALKAEPLLPPPLNKWRPPNQRQRRLARRRTP